MFVQNFDRDQAAFYLSVMLILGGLGAFNNVLGHSVFVTSTKAMEQAQQVCLDAGVKAQFEACVDEGYARNMAVLESVQAQKPFYLAGSLMAVSLGALGGVWATRRGSSMRARPKPL